MIYNNFKLYLYIILKMKDLAHTCVRLRGVGGGTPLLGQEGGTRATSWNYILNIRKKLDSFTLTKLLPLLKFPMH